MIELKNFATRALKRISPVYDSSDFIKYFFNALADDFDLLRGLFKNLRDASFIETVTAEFIAYQELKYSLPIRDDLSLEERRALLGIRATTHRPLNPGRLERAIKDAFGIETYLYEKDAGYIRVYSNQFNGRFKELLDFLKVERPAHLRLGWHLSMAEYIGGGAEKRAVIFNPDVPLELPTSTADKKNYPRLFTGVAEIQTGSYRIGLATLRSESLGIIIGTGKILAGNKTIQPSMLTQDLMTWRLLRGKVLTGSITIDAVPIDPLLLQPLGEDELRIYFGFNLSKHKTLRGFTLKNIKPDLTRAEIKDVTDYAVANKILRNEILGETISKDLGAAWKHKETIQYIIL